MDIDEKAVKTAIQNGGSADELKTRLDEVGEARKEVLAKLADISNTTGRPGQRRQEVIETGSVEDLKTLNAECEIEQAKLERLEQYQGKLRKLWERQNHKEAAERLPEYRDNLAKAARKVAKANKALSEAWAEADEALRTLQTAHGQAKSIHADIQPAKAEVTEAVQAAWQCAHTHGMADSFHSNLRRGLVADLLGHRTKDVSLVPGENKTVFT